MSGYITDSFLYKSKGRLFIGALRTRKGGNYVLNDKNRVVDMGDVIAIVRGIYGRPPHKEVKV